MIAAGELPMDDIISHTFPLKEFRKGIDQVIGYDDALYGDNDDDGDYSGDDDEELVILAVGEGNGGDNFGDGADFESGVGLDGDDDYACQKTHVMANTVYKFDK